MGLDQGVWGYVAGFNSFENNDTNIYALDYSYISAHSNWWGDDPPDESLFYEYESSIDWRLWLSQPLFRFKGKNGSGANSITGNSPVYNPGLRINDKINYAKFLLFNGEIDSLLNVVKDILRTSPENKYSITALRLLSEAYRNEEIKDSLLNFLNSFIQTTTNEELNVFARIITSKNMNQNAFISNINQITNLFPNNDINDLVLFNKFKYYYFNVKDMDNALNVYNTMLLQSPNSELTRQCKKLLFPQNIIEKKLGNNTIEIPEGITLANYPNPFNATTIIRYSINTPEKVTLSIYDILGREVKQLINEEKEPGYYEVTWNANRFASGIYFYRLQAGKNIAINKLMLLK